MMNPTSDQFLEDLQSCMSLPEKPEKLLDAYSDEELISLLGMADMPRLAYLFWIKYHGQAELIPIENDIMLRIGTCNLANFSYLAVTLHFIRIEENALVIEGNTSIPAFLSTSYSFYVRCNGERIDGELKTDGFPKKIGDTVYDPAHLFCMRIPLQETMSIQFFQEINGLECRYGKINSMRFCPVADVIPGQYAVLDAGILWIEQDLLHFETATKQKVTGHEMLFREAIRKSFREDAQWAIDLREQFFTQTTQKTRPIWLFLDRYDKAGDNAAALFRYVQKYPEIDSYFIIDREADDYQRLLQIGQVIPLYSEDHYRLLLLADYVISSQSNGVIENPFWEKAELFRDLYHRPKMVFLQHGVTKDDMSLTLDRFNTAFYGLVVSGEQEQRSFLEKQYHYAPENIWLTGMPRYDELYDASEKVILIIPSWRKKLMRLSWNEEEQNSLWEAAVDLEETDYYRAYKSLLQNKKLRFYCKLFGYRCAFLSHPLMREIGQRLSEQTGCILWDDRMEYREAFAKASLMITDYSSVAFDFAYLYKPVLYYQFDEDVFFNSHTYRRGYYDYRKDGFGEVATQEQELVNKIIGCMKRKMQMLPLYAERVNRFFTFHDHSNCERVYEKLLHG